MTRKYFGTDGIRGRANQHPMTADVALRVAMAAGAVLRAGAGKPHNRVVIGKDTRLSGYMIEQAMSAGFLAMGMDVVLLGPMPTPAVAMLTRSLRADLGVMISASHNPYADNGIKLFGGDGYKLSDAIETAIEARIDNPDPALAQPTDLGRASRLDDASGRYIEFVKGTFPRGQTLAGLRVVVDCAHGAAYRVAPQVLWELQADVIPLGISPNGLNINQGCGATDTALLQKTVVENGADLGIALDGDADRLIMVDETGARVDGDQLMAIIAKSWKEAGGLRNGTVVATVMSNLGLERYLEKLGLRLERTAVGDRYVVERMREGGFNLGGEQSGHMVLSDFATTGDGLIAALQVLAVLRGQGGKDSGLKMSQLARTFEPVPQILESVRFAAGANPLEDAGVRAAIDGAGKSLEGKGRILVRASGTEPVIRVMAEGDDAGAVRRIVEDVCATIKAVA
ncbi:MAG: phosphoglucosamine mutase [Rhodospirillales bacterium]|nr:phosphoglucosamine mutase [Alphaproteobacteria bacterium]MCB9987587.1 phosphoglucosamine mutase [Rhodospirillales bacterium]USO07696.1 MAG: phosphoglucosamine mutase [Rhodospirillales bacterium]